MTPKVNRQVPTWHGSWLAGLRQSPRGDRDATDHGRCERRTWTCSGV